MHKDIMKAVTELSRRTHKAGRQLERAAVAGKEAEAGVAAARATLEGARQYLVDSMALAERAPEDTRALEGKLQKLRLEVVEMEEAMEGVEEEIGRIFLGKPQEEEV